MKSFAGAAALLVLVTGAVARNPTPGLRYCGRTLDHIGNYQPQIDQCLFDAGQEEADNGADDIFYCYGGANGLIRFLEYCSNGCITEPAGVSDACR